MGEKERKTVSIDKESLAWLEFMVKKRQFDSRSAALRKCIEIAKRVYERGSSADIAKFVCGKE